MLPCTLFATHRRLTQMRDSIDPKSHPKPSHISDLWQSNAGLKIGHCKFHAGLQLKVSQASFTVGLFCPEMHRCQDGDIA